MSLDFKVPRRTEEDVEELATRVLSRVEVGSYSFNVMKLIRAIMMKDTSDRSALQIKIIPSFAKHKTPFVKFSPFEFHATQQLINAGDLNHPSARHVLAHELGHMIMHRHYKNYFSSDCSVKLNFLDDEDSAETQAQWFAGYLLVPDKILLEHKVNVQEICRVPAQLVLDRKAQMDERIHRDFYTPRHCACGASLARRRRLLLTCCGCGLQEQL